MRSSSIGRSAAFRESPDKGTQCEKVRQLSGQPWRTRRRHAETGPRFRQPATAPVRQPDLHPQAAMSRAPQADDRHRRALQRMSRAANRDRIRWVRRLSPFRYSIAWCKWKRSRIRSDTREPATERPAGSGWARRRGVRRRAASRPASPSRSGCARCRRTGARSCWRARRRAGRKTAGAGRPGPCRRPRTASCSCGRS